MAVQLDEHAKDRSSYTVTFGDWRDSANNVVTPTALTWTLRNEYEVIINGRVNVTVTPSTSVRVTLSGDDLKYSEGRQRKVQAVALYDSTLGAGLQLRDTAIISVDES